MKANLLEERCYQFALRTLRFCRTLPSNTEGYTIRGQLLRAGLGTVGNYRSARRGRSRREFVALIGKAMDESAEAALWYRLIVDGEVSTSRKLVDCLAKRMNLRRSWRHRMERRAPTSIATPNLEPEDYQITKLANHQMP